MHDFLATKFSRWFPGHEATSMAKKAIKLSENLRAQVPPCVLHALLVSWLNAWCTDRRFQKEPRACVLSEQCKGRDCIAHYAVCEHMWNAAHKKLKVSMSRCSISRFFALEPLINDDCAILAANVYAVLSLTNRLRASNMRCSADSLHTELWEAHRTLSIQHKGLRKRYINIWTA